MPHELSFDALTRLATGDVSGWLGLPAAIDWRAHVEPGDVPAASRLGDDEEPADLLRVTEPVTGATGRVWLRDGRAVLVDVPVAPAGAPAAVPRELGEPERRCDLQYGLHPLPEGEWVYAARGLALIVDEAARIVHALGFAPCSPDDYARRLRVHFATMRRPIAPRGMENGL